MIFRQLFEETSSTYTYLISCPDSGETVLVDPVLETVERDLELIQSLGLRLSATLETHIHADHITGAIKLNALSDCSIAGPAMDELSCRHIHVREGEPFRIGNIELQPLHTPGHTNNHHAYLIESPVHTLVLTGDSLMIESCGRTDFQGGDASILYESVHKKLFTLSDDTLVYPGHDYAHRFVSSIRQEKQCNPRLGMNKSCDEFVLIMKNLKLPQPKKMEYAVPGNEQCGRCPDNMPQDMERLCEIQG